MAVNYNPYKKDYKSYSYSQPIPYQKYNYGPTPSSYYPTPTSSSPKPQYYRVCAFFRGVWKTFDSMQHLKYQQQLGYSK